MGLRELAETDLACILEDRTMGFGWDITVTNPLGVSASFVGYARDVSELIDPDTGEAVSGRFATVALRRSSLIAAGLDLPVGISDASMKPWVIEFNDINGNPFKYKVTRSEPDRALGIVTCRLENYG